MSLFRRFAPLALASVALMASACSSPAADSAPSTASVEITDDFGRTVAVPADPARVAVLEWEGLVAKTLAILGEGDRIVAVDPATSKDPARHVLVPQVTNATDVGSAWSGINYETLASVDPDVLFLEAWVSSDEDRQLHDEAVEQIEGLGIPVVVFMSPSNFDTPSMDTAYDVIRTVGTVFERTEDTDKVVDRLQTGIADVLDRIPADAPAPTVAVFSTIAYVMGEKSVQSHLFADLLGARNTAGAGTFVPVSEEKLLALDPDALIIAGHEGYLGLDEVYGGANVGLDWSKLQTMKAIEDKRVAALGYDEWRATIETPVALLKAASVLYPEAFADVDLDAEELAFYQDVFNLDAAAAQQAVDGQKCRADLGG